ncbi:9167_t:CDS:1, partial [Gigaspora margarita]
DRSFQTNKKALYHIHTSKDSKCSIFENQEDQKHNYKNLSSYLFKQSFTTYSVSEKDSTIPQKTFYNPDFSIFLFRQQYATTFEKPILLHTLNELAFKADQKFAQLNNTETTTKRTAFYLYSHIKAYFKAAAQNDNISELGLEQALEKTIVPTIDPHILARIILYYNI